MRRLVALCVHAWLVVVLTLSLAPTALADDRDPRCAGWELDGPPPGIDIANACPPGISEVTTEDVNVGSEPLFPYIVALIVVAMFLSAFGFVAMRLLARPVPPPKARLMTFWACVACGATNSPDRAACFSCHASRGDPAPPHPA
ncbi:MAG: hypothetical protein ABIR11_09770 [Candidatus Limnocylindrales bacterium]